MPLFKRKKKVVEETVEDTEPEERKKEEDTPRTRWIHFLNGHIRNVAIFLNILRDKSIVYDIDHWRCTVLFKTKKQDFDMVFGNLICGRLFWHPGGYGSSRHVDFDDYLPDFQTFIMSDYIIFLFLKMWFAKNEYFTVNEKKVEEHITGAYQWDEFIEEAKEFIERYGNSVLVGTTYG